MKRKGALVGGEFISAVLLVFMAAAMLTHYVTFPSLSATGFNGAFQDLFVIMMFVVGIYGASKVIL